MTHPYLRPMSAGEIIVSALRVYRDHFRLLVLVALFPHLVLLALETLLTLGGKPSAPAFVMVLLATVVMNAVALAALTLAIGRATLGQEPGLAEVYAQTLRSGLPSVVVAYLITAVLVSAGMMMLVLPGVILGSLFAPTVPIIVLERRGTVDGLARSVALMKAEWIKGTVVFSFFILVAGFLPLFLLLMQGSIAMGPFTPLLGAIVGAVTLPLGFAANVLLYFSLRAEDTEAAAQLEEALKPPLAE
jgi:hypothetical protein